MTEPQIEITMELLHALLEEQHPDLAGLALREVVGGWDNQMWRLGGELAVRLPRTERAPDLQRKERRWLPVLAPRLPLPVPIPIRFGEPSARFPKPWTVTTWVPGEPLDRASISRGDDAADALAGFLRALHMEAPSEAPASLDRGAHPRDCTDGFERFLHAVDLDRIPFDAQDIREIWDAAVAAPAWQGPPVWVHGDLHPANIVVEEGTLAGVIDFGDMFAGDPAWDLAAAWLLLPSGAISRFFEVYESADEASMRRARGLAALKSLFLIHMGQNGDRGLTGGKPSWGPAGRSALERVLTIVPRGVVDFGSARGMRGDRRVAVNTMLFRSNRSTTQPVR
jgi:aminoglycoside phosphotransferase (APT) family kinase protein